MPVNSGFTCALLGTFITFAFGFWNESLTLLVVFMGVDYLTGVYAAIRDGTGLSSSVGFWGLAKKGVILLVILLAHRVDVLLGMQVVMGGAIYFYLANEMLSVVENCGRIGVPIPEKFSKIIQILRERSMNDDPDKGNGKPPPK